jgi:hypothetical protein
MGRLAKRLLMSIFIAGIIALIAFLQSNLDYRLDLRNKLKDYVIYLPPPKYAKLVSLGYQNIVADYLYLWSVQFFSEKLEVQRFKVIDEVFDFVTELDPKYIESYRIGALIMIKDVFGRQRNPQGLNMAMTLLDKGIRNNPGNWILPFEAAQYAHFDIKDPHSANKYYKMTLASAELPKFYRNRIVTAIGDTMEGFNRNQAISYWYNLWQNASDEIVRNIAFSHFYDLKLDLDIEFIKRAIKNYKVKYKRLPVQLSDLVRGKIVPALPYDPYGLPYLYDSATGDVQPKKGYIFKRHLN